MLSLRMVSMLVYACNVCGMVIVIEAYGNSAGDHDPAYHVAEAYHRPYDGKCISDGKDWPCQTHKDYTLSC